MLPAIGRSIWSYRRGLLTIASMGAGGVWLARYVKDQLLHHSRKTAQERAVYSDIERRFEQNQQDVALTIQALLSDLSDVVASLADPDHWMVQLKHTVKSTGQAGTGGDTTAPSLLTPSTSQDHTPSSSSSPSSQDEQPTLVEKPKTKLELWNAVKVESYVRPLASIYLLALLSLLSHTQINLLGRSFYVASVGVPEDDREQSVRMALAGSQRLSWEEERVFLTSLPSHLLHQGARQCVDWVRRAVEEVMNPISLRTPCGPREIREHIEAIRRHIEGECLKEDFFKRCTGWMIPGRDDSDEEERSLLEVAMGHPISTPSPSLRGILDETYDLLESPNAQQVLQQALERLFDLFDQQISVELAPSLPPKVVEINGGEEGAEGGASCEIQSLPRLASLLPRISRTTHKVWDESTNRYIKELHGLPTLRAYSAIVYSSYSTE
ncbi:MAG: Peroxin-3 [Piptocephalis tieghemiana]|nr:MAG: Peroxin-3 [Piptocephalis tieghemiana]